MSQKADRNKARREAQALLDQYAIEAIPVPVGRIAKSLGVRVEYAPLDDELSGLAHIRDDVPIIGINALHTPNRQRFSLAHELAHVRLHRRELERAVHVDRGSLRRDALAAKGVDPIEMEANAFAAELLMPTRLLTSALERHPVDLEDDNAVAALAKRFRVSDAAMRYRLHSFGEGRVSFVIYDVETTGLTKRFDQIVQFAAVLTDSDLNVKDRIESRCRLMPHVVPSPEAMHVTGLRIEQLLDASLPSHYEMVAEVRHTLESWSPTLFLGFNSLPFDEELLRQAFYLCLYDPYLTNTQGNARADVLSLCRMTAAFRSHVVTPATDNDGRAIFKLKPLAKANGIAAQMMSHSAMADVSATLALCKLIKNRAPDIWSQFLRFSQKAAVEAFVTEEDAFVVSETIGNHHRTRVVTRIGRHAGRQARHYCLDVSTDLDALREMSDGELVDLCRDATRPTVTVRTNAAPTLWALYEATQAHLTPFEGEAEILERVERIRKDKDFLERLRNAAQSAEPDYPPSPHLEEQIYGHPFPSRHDKDLMHEFHAASWEERVSLARQFADQRHRRIATRLIYFERPDLLAIECRTAADDAIRKRLAALPDANVPWRSIPAAQRDLNVLLQSDLEGEALVIQMRYLDYLEHRADALTLPESIQVRR